MVKKYPVQSVEDFVAESEAAVQKLADLFNVSHYGVPAPDMPLVVSQATPKSPDTLKDDVEAIRATMAGRELKAQKAAHDALSYTSAEDGNPGFLRTLVIDGPRVHRMFNAVAQATNLWQKSTEELISVGKTAAVNPSSFFGSQIVV